MQHPEPLSYSSATAQISPEGAGDAVPARALILALSAALLGMALHLTDGLYSPIGLGVLTLSFALCIWAAIFAVSSSAMIPLRTFQLFLTGLICVQLFSMLFAPAGATEATVPKVSQFPFQMGVTTAAGGLALLQFGRKMRFSVAGFVLMLVSFAAIGIWKIRSAPEPFIDVFIFHRDAAIALSQGINPYTITFPNIYSADTYVYGQGVVENGRLLFGYPYPPLVLLCTSAAHLVFGDSRYAMMLAMLISAVLIALLHRTRTSMLCAMLLLFTPRAFYLVELAWTEPLCVMFLTAFSLLAYRYYAHYLGEEGSDQRYFIPAAVMLGLLLASKQYLPAALLLTPILLTRRMHLRSFAIAMVIAVTTALIVSLPLMLWDIKAFWQSAITLQMRQPYRPDSLSYLAWYGYGNKDWTGPFWLAFVAMFLSAGLMLWRAPRGIAGFILAFALTYFAFFAFNKQAFANYYYLVLGALCCATALVVPEQTDHNPASRSVSPV